MRRSIFSTYHNNRERESIIVKVITITVMLNGYIKLELTAIGFSINTDHKKLFRRLRNELLLEVNKGTEGLYGAS